MILRLSQKLNTKIKEGTSYGQPIVEFAPSSMGARDFQNLAREIISTEPVITATDEMLEQVERTVVREVLDPLPIDELRHSTLHQELLDVLDTCHEAVVVVDRVPFGERTNETGAEATDPLTWRLDGDPGTARRLPMWCHLLTAAECAR